MKKKELLHGTTVRRVENFLEETEDLFGIRYPAAPGFSATLTDGWDIARASAISA